VNSDVPSTPRLVLPLSDHLQTIVEKPGDAEPAEEDLEVGPTSDGVHSPSSSKSASPSSPAADVVVVPATEFPQTAAPGVQQDSGSSTSVETITADTTVDTPSQPIAAYTVESEQSPMRTTTRPSCLVSALPAVSTDNASCTTPNNRCLEDRKVPGTCSHKQEVSSTFPYCILWVNYFGKIERFKLFSPVNEELGVIVHNCVISEECCLEKGKVMGTRSRRWDILDISFLLHHTFMLGYLEDRKGPSTRPRRRCRSADRHAVADGKGNSGTVGPPSKLTPIYVRRVAWRRRSEQTDFGCR